jgi:hypothetical protein
MSDASGSARPVVTATAVGTILQLAMVVAGHFAPGVAKLFAVGGMSLSAVAGVLFARWANPASVGAAATGGALAGGGCALIGILVSYLLGDVPAAVLGFGTASSAVTGAIGAAVARGLGRRMA